VSNIQAKAEVVVSKMPTAAEVNQAVAQGYKLAVTNEVTESDIIGRIAKAESVTDVFGGSGELVKVKEILGKSIRVLSLDGVRPSEFEGGVGFYLVVNAADNDGDTFSLAVGVTDGIVKLLKLNELGALPRWVAFEESTRKTANGYYPINLVDRNETGGF